MFSLQYYYVIIMLLLFFPKKSNQKKVKVLRMTRRSAYRADDTATHPLIYYVCVIFANLLFRTDRFFHPTFNFPTNIHPRGYVFGFHKVRIFFSDFRKLIKRGNCSVNFFFVEPYFTPPSSYSSHKIIDFFCMLLLFFVCFEGGHIIYPTVEIRRHFSYSAGLPQNIIDFFHRAKQNIFFDFIHSHRGGVQNCFFVFHLVCFILFLLSYFFQTPTLFSSHTISSRFSSSSIRPHSSSHFSVECSSGSDHPVRHDHTLSHL